MNPNRKYFESIVQSIREVKQLTDFDCRAQMLRYGHSENEWNMTDEFLNGYIRPKYAVAKVLQPKRICEIGVYCGIGALSFLGACHDAEYVGIDNLYGEKATGVSLVERTKENLEALGYKATIVIGNTQEMDRLPAWQYDLVHVDGCHTKECAKHDVMLAFDAVTPNGWILVDDSCDMSVCTGTFEALRDFPGGNVYWTNIEGTTGSILIQRKRQ